MRPVAEQVITLTDKACAELLDEEYADLARHVVGKLARKRPSPLLSGRAATWAGGIVWALGQVNFAFDRESKPHVTHDELAGTFGLSKPTLSNKAKQVRDTLKIELGHARVLARGRDRLQLDGLVHRDRRLHPRRALPARGDPGTGLREGHHSVHPGPRPRRHGRRARTPRAATGRLTERRELLAIGAPAANYWNQVRPASDNTVGANVLFLSREGIGGSPGSRTGPKGSRPGWRPPPRGAARALARKTSRIPLAGTCGAHGRPYLRGRPSSSEMIRRTVPGR